MENHKSEEMLQQIMNKLGFDIREYNSNNFESFAICCIGSPRVVKIFMIALLAFSKSVSLRCL